MFQQSSVACLSLLLQQPGGAASLEYKYIVISIEPKTKKQNNSKKRKKKHLNFVHMQQKTPQCYAICLKQSYKNKKSSGAWINSRYV
jgi:hypothetical protein